MTLRRNWTERAWEKRLLDYAHLCAEEPLAPGLFDEIVAMLVRDHDALVVLVDYDAAGKVSSIHQHGYSDDAMQKYRSYFHKRNVFVHAVERHSLGDATTSFEPYIAPDQLRRSEYYNDFLRFTGVEHVLALSVNASGTERTAVSLHRGNKNGGAFGKDEVRRFDRLRPFLRSALMMRRLAAAVATNCMSASPICPARSNQRETPQSGDRVPLKWRLSPRETEVALALADGLSYKEVAAKLGLSFHTVNAHADSLHRKTQMTTARLIALLNRRESV